MTPGRWISKVEEPGPAPKGRGREPSLNWDILKTLQVGQAVDLPRSLPENQLSQRIGYWGKKNGHKYSRRGYRVWRIA